LSEESRSTASDKKIRVLIIDDELLARKRIRRLLDEDLDFEILGECADGQSAGIQILESRPDLVFLDIRIPDIDGFEVLQLIDPPLMPRIVFVAADDRLNRQVIGAFLIGCLLKPISRAQFLLACRRIKDEIHKQPAEFTTYRIQELLDELRKRKVLAYSKWLAAHTAQGFKLVPADEILWLEAPGSGVWLNTEQGFCVVQRSLDEVEKILDPAEFVRISPHALVRIQPVQTIHYGETKQLVLVLRNGVELEVSASYARKVAKRLRP
jgi:two-component system LytT family response regulator